MSKPKKIYRRKPIEKKHKPKHYPPNPIKPPKENDNNRFTILPYPFVEGAF